MARIPDLIPVLQEHGLKILTVAELIRYRLRNERYIVRAGESRIQTRYGEFRMIAYESAVNGGESHIALVKGELCEDCPAVHGGPGDGTSPEGGTNDGGHAGPGRSRGPCDHAVLVRVHTRCTAGDVFAADCHCRETLDQSMRMIAEEGCGAVLYLHNTSRGFEWSAAPVAAFAPGGAAAVEREARGGWFCTRSCGRGGIAGADGRILRAIGLGGQILSDLGIRRIRLLSNTPMHIPALEGFGLEIVEQVAIPVAMSVHLVNPSDNSFGTAVITPRWLFVLAAATPERRAIRFWWMSRWNRLCRRASRRATLWASACTRAMRCAATRWGGWRGSGARG
jgi:3,4-dihydroxy 2-butanone 4-phosphate synthase/GTP cyclohydrolase II